MKPIFILLFLFLSACYADKGPNEQQKRASNVVMKNGIIISVDGIDISEYELTMEDVDTTLNPLNKDYLLCFATEECDEELIRALLEKGADAYYKCDGLNDVIIDLAFCEEKAVALTELFLKYGGRVNSADEDNDSFLSYAITADNLELVDYLLSRGASKTQRDINPNMGCLPVHGCESLAMLKKLEKEGFDLNVTCDNGRNLLHFAARENLIEMAQYLIDKRLVSLNQKDQAGETPLDYAIRFKNPEFAELLRRAVK